MAQKAEKNDGTKVMLDLAQMKSVLMEQKDFLTPVVQEAVQAILEVEMDECLQAGKHERTTQGRVALSLHGNCIREPLHYTLQRRQRILRLMQRD